MSKKVRNYKIVTLIMVVFFVISFLTNAIGPLIPDIISSFGLSFTLVAVLPFSFFIAYGVTSVPAALLNDKFKEKKMMMAAFAISFAGALWLALEPNYIIAVLSLFLIGCGMAILQVVVNPLLRVAGGEEHYAFNSVLAQLFFGLASFVSPLLYSYIVGHLKGEKSNNAYGNILHFISMLTPRTLPWISLYWVFVITCVIMIIVIALSKFPKVTLGSDEKAGTFQLYIHLLQNKIIILYFIGIFCYVGTEQGIANWISQFLYQYYNYDAETVGAKAVANFWGLMTIGGIVGLVLLKFIDSKIILFSFTLFAIIFFTIGLFSSGSVALWALPLVGFLASVMYPVIFSLALNSVTENHGAFSGILLTGVMGGAVVPLIVGWLGDKFGLRTGLTFVYLTMFYILAIGVWAKPIINNKTIQIYKKE